MNDLTPKKERSSLSKWSRRGFIGAGVVAGGGLLIGITVYTGAFITEIVRSGIQSVASGQIEAARALGLRQGRCADDGCGEDVDCGTDHGPSQGWEEHPITRFGRSVWGDYSLIISAR